MSRGWKRICTRVFIVCVGREPHHLHLFRDNVRARLDKEADRNRATTLQKDSELRELQNKLDRVVSFIQSSHVLFI